MMQILNETAVYTPFGECLELGWELFYFRAGSRHLCTMSLTGTS